jgi:hypothetical protein
MQSLYKVGCNRRVQTCPLISLYLQRNMAFSRSKVLLLEKEVADHMKVKNGPNKSSQADMTRKEANYKEGECNSTECTNIKVNYQLLTNKSLFRSAHVDFRNTGNERGRS